MKRILFGFVAAVAFAGAAAMAADGTAPPLGLPPVPIPADNPQTPEKIALGKKLFEDKRFSATGQVSCATCHVYVESAHALPPPEADEDDMLESTAAKRRKNSRLACQISNSKLPSAQQVDCSTLGSTG
jgi:cytochrome c peroxidase